MLRPGASCPPAPPSRQDMIQAERAGRKKKGGGKKGDKKGGGKKSGGGKGEGAGAKKAAAAGGADGKKGGAPAKKKRKDLTVGCLPTLGCLPGGACCPSCRPPCRQQHEVPLACTCFRRCCRLGLAHQFRAVPAPHSPPPLAGGALHRVAVC